MSRVMVGGLVLVCGCLITPVMHFGGGKMGREGQRETVDKITPQGLDTEPAYSGQHVTARIVVYADEQYRAQNTHWESVFGEELDYANRVLDAKFGVRLVADYRTWNRNQPDARLDETLAAIAGHDPGGGDVLSVIALTSSLGLVTATFEELGIAQVGGNHIAIRGNADVEERSAFAAAFPDLTSEERELYFVAQRRHKTTTVLLHELAHNLGAEHADESETIMSAAYSRKAAAFDARTAIVIRSAFDQRVRDKAAPPFVATAAVASKSAPPSLPVLAKAAPPRPRGVVTTLTVTLEPTGVAMFAGYPIADKDLADIFAKQRDDDPDAPVEIHASRNVPPAALERVKQLARAAGLTNVVTVP